MVSTMAPSFLNGAVDAPLPTRGTWAKATKDGPQTGLMLSFLSNHYLATHE